MTLVMALLMMVVLTSVSTTTIYFVTSNVHSTGISKASTSAYDVAEAGLNDSVAKMYNQLDTDGSVLATGIDPRSSTMFPSCVGAPPPAPTSISYTNVGGTALICGDYNATKTATTITVGGVTTPLAGYSWRIQSIGLVSSAGKTQTRTLSKSLKVVGLNDGADGSTWSRFYQDSTASCLTINNMTFVTNVATRGDLCLKNDGAITGANTVVDVGGDVSIIGSNSTSGPRASGTANATWASPGNITSSNNSDATNTIAANTTGSNLDATGFGFAIPATAAIAGIKVSVERGSNPGANAVQSITVTGNPSGGTFKLTGTPPGGSPRATVAINRNAAASGTGTPITVQAALEAVYGSGRVTCSGGPLMSAAVSCTFIGSYASMPVALMTSASSLTGGSSPKAVVTNITNGYTPALQDDTVQLLKAGAIPGSETNQASAAIWGLPDTAIAYGSTSDLWGTTWTPADVNAANFGLRFAAQNTGSSSSTATVDYISITVTYIPAAPGIGTSTTLTKQLNVGGSCTYLNQAAHTPCTATDHTYATTVTTTSAANNPALVMPDVDFNYWWANAMPGPKHFCTNPSPGLATNFFDNNASTTTRPDRSLTVNGEMAPATTDYTCQVWSIPPTGGQLLGELSWNHTTHILKISGTIFVDGNFRFDEDGEVIHYLGRATLMSSRDDEIDALVCAGGSGTTYSTSCLNDMTNWNPSANIMVLMSQENNEYDQGGTSCSGNTHPGCWNGHLPSGFQGIMFSTADCLIHQEFQDSGPVICNTITLPDESGLNPTFFTFPSIGNLTDGQKYGDTVTATNFELDPGDQSGG
jgi:hypothetical protein